MRSRIFFITIGLSFFTSGIFAQLGIKAGLNMANEIKSFSQVDITNAFSSENLTGVQIGLTYQFMPKKSGLGCELGVLLTQKGSVFNDRLTDTTYVKKGYNELNYLEVPFNLRYRVSLGFLGIYGTAGIYAGYALSAKTGDETYNVWEAQPFQTFMNHLDYGWNIGLGLELFKKIQLGGTWTQGIKDTGMYGLLQPTPLSSFNRVFTINLIYML